MLPWVPEPQKKEERKISLSSFIIFFEALVPRVERCQPWKSGVGKG